MKPKIIFIVIAALFVIQYTNAQWAVNGSHIYNTNAGNVGIGNNAPASLLYVGKNMTEPTITVRNLGGAGGATYSMVDDASGANWKFKATNSGGFKIRDFANSLDVFQIEANSAANVIYINAAGAIGINTATPATSALMELNATDRGFLPPRMSQSQLSAIAGPANGLMAFNTTDGKLYVYVGTVNTWKEISLGAGTIAGECGNSFVKNHVAGTVAPVTKTVTYGTLTNVAGETSKCWITQNLGADHQASAVNDGTEASAGWYWQFNRQQGYKHDGSSRTPNTAWINSINENSNWQSVNDPCTLLLGSTWRLPTSTEWTNVDAAGSWTDWNGPWNSLLKMHAAGYLHFSSGNIDFRGSLGYYWSTQQSDNSWGFLMSFGNSYCESASTSVKASGHTVRCVK
jgi:hypothetical protein